LQRPVILAAFSGWNDAADAASTAVQALVAAWDARPLAQIDPEQFTDFATIRPMVRLTPEGRRTIVWPTVELWHARTPGSDVILMLGPEPSLRWRLFCDQVMAVADRFDASMLITLGALLADVPHTRPVHLIGTATDDALVERYDLQRSTYEGPTGIVGVLHDACSDAGMASVSLWAAVPAYASQVPSPKAAAALIERAADIIGTPAPTSALVRAVADYEQRIDQLVDEDEDLAEYVERIGTMGDDTGDAELPFDGDEDEIDDGATLADEVEQFLRDQDGR
jgi:proteasome assembly chaperone (PAC2) family protein